MASQSLYRKWRSQTFNEMVGQEEIKQTLKNALINGTLRHAYLFTGPRGTGKTSTARLLAKTVNCANPINGEPCNQCQQCREITAGNSFNVIEIDAASNRGIDSIRELREKVMMPPSTGKYKVYVLDEAHMLTTEAFNALLKTLEEPPEYAIFVLATTDVHKLLPTVLSRCQRFDFKRFTTRQIVAHLNHIAKEEGITIERSAVELIARAAAGGMRDALSLLDQAIAYAGEEIALSQVQAMLGVADPRAIHTFVTHAAQLDSAAGLHLIHELAEAGADLRQVNIQIGEYWRALMLAKAGADIAVILDLTEDESKEIAQLAPNFTLEELTEIARIFAQNDLAQKNQGTPQLGLELALLQSIELHRRAQSGLPLLPSAATPVQPLAAPASPAPAQSQARPITSQAAPRNPASSTTHTPAAATAPQEPVATPSQTPAQDATEWDEALVFDSREDDFEPDAPVQASPVSASAAQHAASNGAPKTGNHPTLSLEQAKKSWERVKKRVKGRNQTGPSTSAYLNDYTIVGVEGADDGEGDIVILQAAHALHYEYMRKGDRCADVEWALSLEFNQKCRVRLLAPGDPVTAAFNSAALPLSSPAATKQPAHSERNGSDAQSSPSRSAKPRNAGPEGLVAQSFPDRQQDDTGTRAAASPAPTTYGEDAVPPVAKKTIVRENSMSESARKVSEQMPVQPSALASEAIAQKASHDPVVQEVMRTFGAKIVDIRPK
jgi:DNA polymerase-3 subunit gamma/tau